jgi:hypothetical protein
MKRIINILILSSFRVSLLVRIQQKPIKKQIHIAEWKSTKKTSSYTATLKINNDNAHDFNSGPSDTTMKGKNGELENDFIILNSFKPKIVWF